MMDSIHTMAHPPVQASLGGALQTSARGMDAQGSALQKTADDIANAGGTDDVKSQQGGRHPDLVHSVVQLHTLSAAFKLNAKAFSTIDDLQKTLFHTGADSQPREYGT